MRIIFAGTPDFAAHTLTALCQAGHEVICVYTQPDRKTGRGQKLTPPAVKQVALDHSIDVRQPLSFKAEDDYQALKSSAPDLMIVVAYGMLLPQRVLDIPRYGCLNIHASLLPRWRGAAPIQRAIEAGDKETGVCIMQMEAGLDTGPVLSESKLPIAITDTSASLHDQLAELGTNALLATLASFDELRHNASPQDHTNACYAHKISKAEASINWNESALQIQQRIRAFNPWPICQSICNEQRLRVWQAAVIHTQSTAPAGTIIAIEKAAIHVSCGTDILAIQVLQRDGSKPLPVQDFMNSSDLKVGDVFTFTE